MFFEQNKSLHLTVADKHMPGGGQGGIFVTTIMKTNSPGAAQHNYIASKSFVLFPSLGGDF